jgi:hypothetical protein
MNSFGFIITRHINSETTNKYWNQSVKLLRTLYPERKIVIIDDNSNQDYVKGDFDYENIIIVKSEFPGSGEILPYYYYLKHKYFENAVILHDSVFFHKRLNFDMLLGYRVLPLWHFNSDKENISNTLRITESLNNKHELQNKLLLNDNVIGLPQSKWYGCFGSQSYINYDFLSQINNKYNLINLVSAVKNRSDRCCLERILGCIFFTESPKLFKMKSIFGDIMRYQVWCDYTYDKYMANLKKGTIPRNVVKIWSGR